MAREPTHLWGLLGDSYGRKEPGTSGAATAVLNPLFLAGPASEPQLWVLEEKNLT